MDKNVLFDSHAHLDDDRFNEDRDRIIPEIHKSGVGLIINVGSDMRNSKKSIELTKKYDYIYAAVGVHPHCAKDLKDSDIEQLAAWTKEKKVVAIGEIGLDFHYDNSPRDVQRFWFKKQLRLAEVLNMPAIIHCREANEECIKILKESKAKGVMHCYSGSLEMAKDIVKMGYAISFGGPLTYKNARTAVDVATHIDIEHILIETDCPYLSPEGSRGQRNDSSKVRNVCEKLAEIKGMSFDEAARITAENAKRVFRM